jgi:nicotinamide mononucleotide adenylyltransferase
MPVLRRKTTWDDIWWKWVRNGVPREDAAFRADEWERQASKPSRAHGRQLESEGHWDARAQR